MDIGQLFIIILLILILLVIITFVILTLMKKSSTKTANNGLYALYENNNDTDIISTSRRFTRNANMPSAVKINIRTRNEDDVPEYKTIGTLYNSDTTTILKLVGKAVYRGSSNWNYYAISSDYNPNRLTVLVDGKDCAKEYGCRELNDNNITQIKEYANKDFTVQLYPKETLNYIPSI